MADLIESRISEIRELASKLEDATMAMDLKVIRALVTRLKYAVSRPAPLDPSSAPAHSSDSVRTSLVDTHEETQMEQHQVLAKWLELARVVKSKIEHGDVEGAYKLADQLASQLLLGKLFGLPDASPLYREDVHDALNAYTETVVERVTAVCTKGAYDAAKHAENAAALDEIINALPSRSPSSAPSETPDWLHGARRCTAFSKSWDEQCQLTDGHAGDHASGYGNVDEQGVIPPIAWTDDIYRGEGAC